MIKILKYRNVPLLSVLLLFAFHCSAGYFRTATFDEIREEGGFKSASLSTVFRVEPSGDPLSDEEKRDLLDSESLLNVHSMDLRNQNIDDGFIEKFCKNKTYSRLINLDVSDNQGITNASVQHILTSPVLGSIRDLPQISGRFGVPSSVIYLTARNTLCHPKEGRGDFYKYLKGVSVKYIHPVTGLETSETVDYAVRIVEVAME